MSSYSKMIKVICQLHKEDNSGVLWIKRIKLGS